LSDTYAKSAIDVGMPELENTALGSENFPQTMVVISMQQTNSHEFRSTEQPNVALGSTKTRHKEAYEKPSFARVPLDQILFAGGASRPDFFAPFQN
jgi:hypothetical protein